MPRKNSVVEWDGKPGRMPPRMGAWQPERLRYGAATKNQRVAERFPERKANATRSWMDGAGIGSLGGVRRKQRTRRIGQSRQPPHSLRRRRVLLAVVYRFVFLGGCLLYTSPSPRD